MNIPKSCDVVVIGADPSGSAAATELSKKGYEIVLFDKVKHSRFMVGDSLLPHAWRYFDLLGVTSTIEKEGFIAKSVGTVSCNLYVMNGCYPGKAHIRPVLFN